MENASIQWDAIDIPDSAIRNILDKEVKQSDHKNGMLNVTKWKVSKL